VHGLRYACYYITFLLILFLLCFVLLYFSYIFIILVYDLCNYITMS